jgi:hypothetical protein
MTTVTVYPSAFNVAVNLSFSRYAVISSIADASRMELSKETSFGWEENRF